MESNNEDEPHFILLDVHVNVRNTCVLSTKLIMTGNRESFSKTIISVFTEYSQSKEYSFVGRDDFVVYNDNPIKLEVRVMMARLIVFRCVGETRMSLLKIFQRSGTVLTKQLDTK